MSRNRAIVVVVLTVILLVFVVLNRRPVQVCLLPLSGFTLHLPLAIVIFISAAVGFVMGVTAATFRRRRRRG